MSPPPPVPVSSTNNPTASEDGFMLGKLRKWVGFRLRSSSGGSESRGYRASGTGGGGGVERPNCGDGGH